MNGKLFYTAEAFQESCFHLVKQIIESGYRPTFLAAVWRGGSMPGTVVQEVMRCFGIPTDHIAIRTSGYDENDRALERIGVYGIDYISGKLRRDDRLLIVDDVFDRGLSIAAIIEALRHRTGENFPAEVRVATIDYKPEKNVTERVPDYYVSVRPKDTWIVYPHEYKGLSLDEIRKSKGPAIAGMYEAIERLLAR